MNSQDLLVIEVVSRKQWHLGMVMQILSHWPQDILLILGRHVAFLVHTQPPAV